MSEKLSSEQLKEIIGGCVDDCFEPTPQEMSMAAEVIELRARLASYPADWRKDSSLQTWFPLTAEEISKLRDRLAEYKQASSSMPDAEDLEFEIDLLENFESDGETGNAQLICWLKELQRRRAAMLANGDKRAK